MPPSPQSNSPERRNNSVQIIDIQVKAGVKIRFVLVRFRFAVRVNYLCVCEFMTFEGGYVILKTLTNRSVYVHFSSLGAWRIEH